MGWNVVTSLLLVSDVVVLGILNSVKSVTNYTLTKYVPENLIGVIVIVVMGIMPGLGGIIGTEETTARRSDCGQRSTHSSG